jgi:hypothetical protein
MKPYIASQMAAFMEPSANEEAVDQPLYHVQTYGTAGAASFTFFNVSSTDLSITNMDNAKVLSKGKRFAVFSLSIAFIPGQLPVQLAAGSALDSALNDAKKVLEGAAYLQLSILDKVYLTESPLTRVPAGQGIHAAGAAFDRNLAVAADGIAQISYGTNGVPLVTAKRLLRVPVPIPEQVQFGVTVYFPTAVTITTAGKLGCWLDGVLIRARQ